MPGEPQPQRQRRQAGNLEQHGVRRRHGLRERPAEAAVRDATAHPLAEMIEVGPRDRGERRDPSRGPPARRPPPTPPPIPSRGPARAPARPGSRRRSPRTGRRPARSVGSPRTRGGHRAPAGAAAVVADHPEPLRQERHHPAPQVVGVGPAVHQHDRLAVRVALLEYGELDGTVGDPPGGTGWDGVMGVLGRRAGSGSRWNYRSRTRRPLSARDTQISISFSCSASVSRVSR